MPIWHNKYNWNWAKHWWFNIIKVINIVNLFLITYLLFNVDWCYPQNEQIQFIFIWLIWYLTNYLCIGNKSLSLGIRASICWHFPIRLIKTKMPTRSPKFTQYLVPKLSELCKICLLLVFIYHQIQGLTCIICLVCIQELAITE